MIDSKDYEYIQKCFELARNGRGLVSPNPLVGAVIVKDGEIISEGYHKKYGGNHAEAEAILTTEQDLTGATLYCNLEPCCHTDKQTPPCVPLIIKSGIKRVVISNLDPNPLVNGKGILQLSAAGIEVTTGILADSGEKLNRFFFKAVRKKIPYITIKFAQSKDGFINSNKAERTKITSDNSDVFVHHQRSIFDAVLVGAKTINIDNPELTVRKVEGRNPIRIILDGMLSSNINSNVFNDEWKNHTWVFTSKTANDAKKEMLRQRGIRIIEMFSDSHGKLDIDVVMRLLYTKKISSVFVEGGSDIFSQFIRKDLIDELIILEAPIFLGKGIKAFNGEIPKNLKLELIEALPPDEKKVFKRID
ncbi:MAG: bifunctional diaminohydroxyphosphoribosylaminopyrimidine deaminase/5-amino-6-(5-phosphoribosylamino)uracil reductase RibD [Melioribacteraceae bacterium]